MNFIETFRAYLEQHTDRPVKGEYLPDQPDELVAFFIYGNIPAVDASLTRYVQVHVRGLNPISAYEEATRLSHLMDSGADEVLLDIGNGWLVHFAPTQRPKSFGQDEQKRFTYYFEVAAWSDDRA